MVDVLILHDVAHRLQIIRVICACRSFNQAGSRLGIIRVEPVAPRVLIVSKFRPTHEELLGRYLIEDSLPFIMKFDLCSMQNFGIIISFDDVVTLLIIQFHRIFSSRIDSA